MKKSALLIVIVLAFSAGFAQVKLTSGKLRPIKGTKVINLIFDFDDVKVGQLTEKEYIDNKVDAYNEDEKGKGDKWKQTWISDRSEKYQPKFEELFNKYVEKYDLEGAEGAVNAEYTMVIKTTKIEPGFNVGFARHTAHIYATITIYETKNPENIIAILNGTELRSSRITEYDYGTGARIQETYAKLGTQIGQLFAKNLKK